MREGQLVVGQLTHGVASGLDAAQLPTAQPGIVDGVGSAAKGLGAEEHELAVNLSHASPHSPSGEASLSEHHQACALNRRPFEAPKRFFPISSLVHAESAAFLR